MTDPSLVPILTDLRDEMRTNRAELSTIRDSVTKQTTLMETLLAPGGRIPKLESDVGDLKTYKAQADATVKATVKTTATVWGGITFVGGLVGHWILDLVRGGAHPK